MKKILLFLLFVVLFAACADETTTVSDKVKSRAGLVLLTDANPEWQYENLRIYPVVADASVLERQASVQRLKRWPKA